MKVCIFTLGCKVNQYESERIKDLFLQKGVEATVNLEYADIYIINTCAVTNEGEKKSRQAVQRVLNFNANAKVYVMGCAAQHDKKQFETKTNVVYCIGNNYKNSIVDFVLNNSSELTQEKSFNNSFFDELTDKNMYTCSKIRTHIKIQDGCNNFCSYCLIPYLRGRSRSRDFDSIIEEAKIVATKCKEIVLVGIDLSSFESEGKNLIDLVEQLDELGVRVRLGSLELSIIDQSTLKRLNNCKNFAQHFHLSLQNACDETLVKMNRHYTFEKYYNCVKMIRSIMPNASITTDIIVGFPTETEQNAQENLVNVEKLQFSKIHIFEYSSRSGTRASKMEKVNTSEQIKNRIKQLEIVEAKSEKQFLTSQLQKVYDVLIEELKGDHYEGYTANYIKVYLPKTSKVSVNQMVRANMKSLYKCGILGEIV